jgi:hypothetical protein
MPNYYDVGDIVRTSSTFTDTGGTRADPTTVHYVLTTPDGTDTENTRTSTDTGLVDLISRSTAGIYFRDVTIGSSSGTYWYRFSSTGIVTSAAEANFRVRRQYTST